MFIAAANASLDLFAREPRLAQVEAIEAALIAEGVWLRPLGKALYLMPPLTIAPEELRHLLTAMHKVLAQ